MELEEYAKYNKCFTYASKDMNLIFLSDFLKEKDSVVLLLHEIGHIMLDHIFNDKGLISDNVVYENEANEFAYLVQRQVQKRKVISCISWTAFYTIISVSCITVLFMGFRTLKNDTEYDDYNTSDIIESNVTSIPETDTVSETSSVSGKNTTTIMSTTSPDTTTTAGTTITEDDYSSKYSNEIYYVTKTGEKYHREDCYYISGHTVVAMSLEDLEKMGYQPCDVCIGEQ